MSTEARCRGPLALAATVALIVMALAGAAQAQASTIYACAKKNGTARVYTKKPKCKKGEKLLSWNTTGPAGKNGANGANGSNGAAGQPQSAVTFASSTEASLTEPIVSPLFTLSGVTVSFACTNALVADVTSLEARGPSGTHAISGMTDSKSNNKEGTVGFQQDVYNVAVGTSNTMFAAISTDGGTPKGNVGYIDATITTAGAVIFIDAVIEAKESPNNCSTVGSAFSIPT